MIYVKLCTYIMYECIDIDQYMRNVSARYNRARKKRPTQGLSMPPRISVMCTCDVMAIEGSGGLKLAGRAWRTPLQTTRALDHSAHSTFVCVTSSSAVRSTYQLAGLIKCLSHQVRVTNSKLGP